MYWGLESSDLGIFSLTNFAKFLFSAQCSYFLDQFSFKRRQYAAQSFATTNMYIFVAPRGIGFVVSPQGILDPAGGGFNSPAFFTFKKVRRGFIKGFFKLAWTKKIEGIYVQVGSAIKITWKCSTYLLAKLFLSLTFNKWKLKGLGWKML